MSKQELATTQKDLAVLAGLEDKHDVALANEIAGGGYLPFLKLVAKTSPLVDKGVTPNHWIIMEGEKVVDLGKEADVIVVAWRPMALDSNEGVVSFDPGTEIFKRLKTAALQKVDKVLYGNQYLVYVCGKQRFTTYFACSPTARRESEHINSNLRKPITFTSKICKNKDYTWVGPTVIACSSKVNVPSMEEVLQLKEEFENPPAPVAKEVAKTSSRD